MKLHWRIGIQQRVLPVYRTQLFEMIAQECSAGVQLFAGAQRRGEGIAESAALEKAVLVQAKNLYIPAFGSHFLLQRNFLDWLKKWKPECLIVEANPRNLFTPGAVRWARQNHARVIGWGLGVPAGKIFATVKNSFWGWFLQQFDALITYSTAGKQSYSGTGFPQERIFLAPNAVAIRPEKPVLERGDHFRDRPNILTVGRMIDVKRVDTLLLACAQLPEQIQPRLTIAGDGPAREKWMDLARSVYPLASFPGDVRGECLDEYFQAADLFVLPGSGGLAVQQAMSHALPVVVGAADGTQTDLVRKGNGWILTDGGVATLALTLQDALSDIRRLRRMGRESWRIVRDEVNLEKMVDAFTGAIGEVMKFP